jgi:hypothetical protein
MDVRNEKETDWHPVKKWKRILRKLPCSLDKDTCPLFLPATIQFWELASTSYNTSSCHKYINPILNYTKKNNNKINGQDENLSSHLSQSECRRHMFVKLSSRCTASYYAQNHHRQHAFTYEINILTPHEEDASDSGFFNRSILHLTLTSWPTLRQSDEKGKNPTATHGSSTGLCNASATLNTISPESSSLSMMGAWAPTVLFPDIPYFKFSMLSCCVASSANVILIHIKKNYGTHQRLISWEGQNADIRTIRADIVFIVFGITSKYWKTSAVNERNRVDHLIHSLKFYSTPI